MKIIKKILIILILLVILLIVSKNIVTRIQWQKKFDKTVFVIDFSKMFYDDIERRYFKEKIRSLNIKTVILNWDENFLTNFEYFKKENFNIIIKFSPEKRYNFFNIKNFVSANVDVIKSIILEPLIYKGQNFGLYKIGTEYLITEIGEIIKTNNLWCINFELNKFPIGKIFKIKDKVLRGFVLDFNLVKKDYIVKVRKAIKERNCKIICLFPSEFMSFQENFDIVEKIISDNENFVTINWDVEKYKTINFHEYTNFFVIIFYIFIILFCYKVLSRNVKVAEITFLLINLCIILAGIIIYGLLQDYYYVMLNRNILGIKIMFLSPIILFPFVIFKRDEINKFLDYNLKIRDMILFIILLIGLYYIILRIGNVSRNLVLPIELQIRNFIENIILFRPRFKEIFFGQPALIFSLKMIKMNEKNTIGKIFLWASVLGPVSVLNTFLHIHTPLQISLLRTFTGMVIGFLIGESIFFYWKFVVNFFKNRL